MSEAEIDLHHKTDHKNFPCEKCCDVFKSEDIEQNIIINKDDLDEYELDSDNCRFC